MVGRLGRHNKQYIEGEAWKVAVARKLSQLGQINHESFAKETFGLGSYNDWSQLCFSGDHAERFAANPL